MNDIALIRLKSPANLRKPNINTICLPVEEGNQFENLEDEDNIKENLIVAGLSIFQFLQNCNFKFFKGWGTTENGTLSDVLMKATVSHISNDDCFKEMHNRTKVHDSWLCTRVKTKKISPCHGDSGKFFQSEMRRN